jgi:hypothetical protein
VAHEKFISDATTLTDDETALFTLVDAKLGERARARRAGYVPADSNTPDERRGLKQFVTWRTS